MPITARELLTLGYQCYYLPTAAIVHLNHKGGYDDKSIGRFRSLTMFEIWSYRYYRKHIRTSTWSPMQIVVVLGLSFHFLALASAQVFAELARVAREVFQTKKPVTAENKASGARR